MERETEQTLPNISTRSARDLIFSLIFNSSSFVSTLCLVYFLPTLLFNTGLPVSFSIPTTPCSQVRGLLPRRPHVPTSIPSRSHVTSCCFLGGRDGRREREGGVSRKDLILRHTGLNFNPQALCEVPRQHFAPRSPLTFELLSFI